MSGPAGEPAVHESQPGGLRRRRLLMMAGVGTAAALAGAAVAWLRLAPQAAAGAQRFWALKLITPAGEPLDTASWRGRPLLVNFWATWCPPCIDELPLLDGFYRQNSPKGFHVVGLAIDQVEPVQRFLLRVPVSFPVAMAGLEGTDLGRQLGNESGGLPFSVLLGREGGVLRRKMGQLTSGELAQWALLE